MSLIIVILFIIPSVTAYDSGRRSDGTTRGIILSQAGGELENPPIYHPRSQEFDTRQFMTLKLPHAYWVEEQSENISPENRNCLLCEHMDKGICNAMPSCVFCEETVTASCELSIPCVRCQVIKNPFFRCVPGEKYMDECNSCRCTDGHAGWCTNMHCEYSSLNIYAMKLSEAEYY